MRKSTVRSLMMGAVLTLGAATPGCMGSLDRGDVALVVETPTDGAVLSGQNVRVTGSSRTEVVYVDGVEVPVIDGRWGTTVPREDGHSTITVRAETVEVEVALTVDSVPPQIVIDEPTAPGFIEGDTFRVVGHIVDDTDVIITADDEAVTMGLDNTFVIERPVEPGAYRTRLFARDAAGHKVYLPVSAVVGHFAEYGAPVEDAAALTVAAPAFGEISRGLTDMLNSPEFRWQIASGIVGDHGDAVVRSLTYSHAEVSIVPVEGGLHARAVIYNLHVNGFARVRIWTPFGDIVHNQDVDLRAEALEITAQMNAWAEAGRIQASVASSQLVLHGFSYNAHDVPGFIEGFFRGTIRGAIESAGSSGVTNALNSEVPSALADVSLDAAIDVLGTPIALEGSFRELALDPNGMYVRLDLSAWSGAAQEDRMAVGHLVQSHAPFTRPDVPSVAAEISLDTMNALTFAIWSGFVPYDVGLLPGATSDEVTVGQLALLTHVRNAWDEYDARDRVSASIGLGLPPVITMGEDGNLLLTAADARISLSAVLADETTEHLVELSVFLSASVAVMTGPDGTLQVVIGELTISADALDPPHGFVAGDDLDEILDDIAPLLTTGLLDFGGIEMPSLAGFVFETPVYTVGDNAVRLDATLTYGGTPELP